MNLGTSTGFGSTTYWNAFVANLEMHGKGTFYDPRLNDATQFPVAVKAGSANVRSDSDLITSKLASLHFYQLAIPAPQPPQNDRRVQLPRTEGKSAFQRQSAVRALS